MGRNPCGRDGAGSEAALGAGGFSVQPGWAGAGPRDVPGLFQGCPRDVSGMQWQCSSSTARWHKAHTNASAASSRAAKAGKETLLPSPAAAAQFVRLLRE